MFFAWIRLLFVLIIHLWWIIWGVVIFECVLFIYHRRSRGTWRLQLSFFEFEVRWMEIDVLFEWESWPVSLQKVGLTDYRKFTYCWSCKFCKNDFARNLARNLVRMISHADMLTIQLKWAWNNCKYDLWHDVKDISVNSMYTND